MSQAGWIKIHRKILEHPRFNDPEWLSVWMYLLLNATHGEYPAIFNGRQIALKPGQLITGRLSIAEKTGVHDSKVYRVLENLKTEHQIEQQVCNKHSLITVLNWHLYQSIEQHAEQLLNNKRTTNEQQLNTNKKEEKDKNEREREEGEAPAAADFALWVLRAKESGAYPNAEIDLVLKKLLDYCRVHNKQPTEARFISWLKKERPATQTGNGATPKRSGWHITEDIKAINDAISKHPANPDSIWSSGSYTEEQKAKHRAEYRQLKNRLSELEKEKLEVALAGAKGLAPEQKAEPVKTDKALSNFEKMRREFGS